MQISMERVELRQQLQLLRACLTRRLVRRMLRAFNVKLASDLATIDRMLPKMRRISAACIGRSQSTASFWS